MWQFRSFKGVNLIFLCANLLKGDSIIYRKPFFMLSQLYMVRALLLLTDIHCVGTCVVLTFFTHVK